MNVLLGYLLGGGLFAVGAAALSWVVTTWCVRGRPVLPPVAESRFVELAIYSPPQDPWFHSAQTLPLWLAGVRR